MIASTPKFDIKTLLTRPEVLTLILAVVVSALVASPLPARAGLEIPQQALTQTITAFWAVFLGALFEGKLKGADYAGGIKTLAGSFKFRAAIVQVLVIASAAVFKPPGVVLPDEVLTQLGTFIVYAILGKTALDGYQTVAARTQ
jgi:hypothetical protein